MQLKVRGGGRDGKQEMIAKEYEISIKSVENVLKQTVVMITSICEYTKNH